MTPRIVLLGRDGQLARELAPLLSRFGEVTAFGRADLDLRETSRLRETLLELAPALIVNAAAYTAVDAAERDVDDAFAINTHAPRVIGDVAAAIDSLMIHFSTDYVFDGMNQTPYVETDRAVPLSVYGASKLAGEQEIAASRARAFVFRLSWLYTWHGRNFLSAVRTTLLAQGSARVVSDTHGTPTAASAVADAMGTILHVCTGLTNDSRFTAADDRLGLYHFGTAEDVTRLEFASAVRDAIAPAAQVVPVAAADYVTVARRPVYSVLGADKLRQAFNVTLPPWRSQLASVLSAARLGR